MDVAKRKVANLPSVRRLPAYLHLLQQLSTEGFEFISGTYIANELKLEPIQVRKDLAITGVVGKPRVGFPVLSLIESIERYLGWDNTTEAFLVGAGNLGSALLGYQGFKQHGLNVVAAFDSDPDKFDTEIHGVQVLSLDKLSDLANRLHVQIGIITVPAPTAQQVADMLVDAGITGIWNFTPTTLRVPTSVAVQNEDLACGLAVLSKKVIHARQMQHLDAEEAAAAGY